MSDQLSSINEERRALAAKVVDRIISDESFRKQVTTNPDKAMNDAFGQEWQHVLATANEAEVSGYIDSAEVAADSNCCQGGTCLESY